MADTNTVKVDGVEMTIEQFNEKKRTLPSNLRLVETSMGYYITLEKLNG